MEALLSNMHLYLINQNVPLNNKDIQLGKQHNLNLIFLR